MALIAYPGGAQQRDRNIALMQAHSKADELVKGRYWEGGKGCAVGCILHDYGHSGTSDHMAFESLFGVPVALARLQDTIFEHLPNAESQKWPVRFWEAIQPGADLSLVQWQFLAFAVRDALERPSAASVREACQPALNIVEAAARGEPIDESAAWRARIAAESAARSTASVASVAALSVAALRAAARGAAWSAAVWRAAWCAVESAKSAESAAIARSAVWKRYAGKLIELMAAAPIIEPAA